MSGRTRWLRRCWRRRHLQRCTEPQRSLEALGLPHADGKHQACPPAAVGCRHPAASVPASRPVSSPWLQLSACRQWLTLGGSGGGHVKGLFCKYQRPCSSRLGRLGLILCSRTCPRKCRTTRATDHEGGAGQDAFKCALNPPAPQFRTPRCQPTWSNPKCTDCTHWPCTACSTGCSDSAQLLQATS